MLRAFWSSEKTFKKALTSQKTCDIIKVQKKERKQERKTKVYEIVTVEAVEIYLEEIADYVIERIRNVLYEDYDIDYDKQDSMYLNVVKEVAKNLLERS